MCDRTPEEMEKYNVSFHDAQEQQSGHGARCVSLVLMLVTPLTLAGPSCAAIASARTNDVAAPSPRLASGMERYTPSRMEWLLLWATVFGTPERLFADRMQQVDGCKLHYDEGETPDTIVVGIARRKTSVAGDSEHAKVQLAIIKDRVETFLLEKAVIVGLLDLQVRFRVSEN
jgi:hypothetical protein